MMKKYHLMTMYRGMQFARLCFAKSNAQAAKIFEVSPYIIKNWALNPMNGEYFEGIKAMIDSGRLVQEYPEIRNKEIPLAEMHKLIDKSQDKYYKN